MHGVYHIDLPFLAAEGIGDIKLPPVLVSPAGRLGVQEELEGTPDPK